MNTFFVVPNEDKQIFEKALVSTGVEFSIREGVSKESTRFDFEADGNAIVMVGLSYGLDLSIKRMQQVIKP